MTRILVTGAAGFIGYHLANRLADRPGVELVLVDNFVRGENDSLYRRLCHRPGVEAHDLDLTDPAQVARLPDDVDIVYHEAALNGTQNFYERPYEVLRSGTLPTFYLVDKYVRRGKLARFVYAGTPESYASTVSTFDWEVPTDETVPLCVDDVFNPRWSYAAAKIHGEVLTINACRQFDVPFSIIRYHNVYGPRMGDKHVVPDFLNRLKHGAAELYGHDDTRSFLYVDDAVEATMQVGECAATAGEVVNVGGLDELTILELGNRMMRLLGRDPAEIALHPSPPGSVKRRVPSIEKLQSLTGFHAQWSLDAGLAETIRSYVPELLPDHFAAAAHAS
jgi:nucleoside-diphosphate-sugar epimerase